MFYSTQVREKSEIKFLLCHTYLVIKADSDSDKIRSDWISSQLLLQKKKNSLHFARPNVFFLVFIYWLNTMVAVFYG